MAGIDLRVHGNHPDAHRSGRARRRREGFVHRDRAVAAGLRIFGSSPRSRDEHPGDGGAVSQADDRDARLQALRGAGRRLGRGDHVADRRGARRPRLRHPYQHGRDRSRRRTQRARADARGESVPRRPGKVPHRRDRLPVDSRDQAADARVRAERFAGRTRWRGSSRSSAPGAIVTATSRRASRAINC